MTDCPTALCCPALPDEDPARRRWLIATGGGGAIGLAAGSLPLLQTLAPSERARALGAGVRVSLDDIPPGGLKTVEWRGQPVWILHRTPDMHAALARAGATLADPQSRRDGLPEALRNPGRSLHPPWLVVIGLCTHLGCVPAFEPAGSPHPALADTGWAGGFLCPCHGSLFDLAGRVFRNKPAPSNLVVPPHHFVDAHTLFIGEPTS